MKKLGIDTKQRLLDQPAGRFIISGGEMAGSSLCFTAMIEFSVSSPGTSFFGLIGGIALADLAQRDWRDAWDKYDTDKSTGANP